MSGHRVVPVGLYYGIFLALIVLTGITVWVASRDFGALNTLVAMSIACVKGSLVVLYFMHVRWSGRLIPVFIVTALIWLIILIGLTMSDYVSRGWLPYPGT